MAALDIPDEWTKVTATLIPKVPAAKALTKFRPVACLRAMRKLWGYVWLELLPPLRFQSLQTAFVKGTDAAQGVYTIKRVAELAREWDAPVVAVQLDLKKAFDK
eukprot:462291-Alexandrium_andersonii.AAC.1